MLHATEVLGAEVYDVNGNFAGRVRELFIVPADQSNRVGRLLLARGKYRPLVARHDQVAYVSPGTIRLNADEMDLEPYRPNEGWLSVGKDLLDQQVIDTSGRKVVRINDVDLIDHRTNGNVELRIWQVDVGLPGAVRRLLQGMASPSLIRRIQEKLPPRVIRWEFVNLIEPDPMRRVKLRIDHRKLEKIHPADLADIMEKLSPEERQAIIDSIDEEVAAEALAELDKRLQAQIMENMDPEKAADILEEMDPDAAADLLADLTPETSKEVLQELPREEAQEFQELLRYPENSAGGLMNTEFVYVGDSTTRDEVLRHVMENDVNLEQLDSIFLINREAKLTGVVAMGRLLVARIDQPLSELKSDPLVFVEPEADEREVFELFDKYNLRSLAVTNTDGCPVGAIAVDDVVSRLRSQL